MALGRLLAAFALLGALPRAAAGGSGPALRGWGLREDMAQVVSVDEVNERLVNEIDIALHSGVEEVKFEQLLHRLESMYNALPKNQHQHLGHAAVRYALHRFFSVEHAWFLRGLQPDGESWRASNATEILKDRVPGYIHGLFEAKLGGSGLDLRELTVFAATLDDLVQNETRARLVDAFAESGVPTVGRISAEQADRVLETYISWFQFSDAASLAGTASTTDSSALLAAQEFARDTRRNLAYERGSNPFVSGTAFASVQTAAEDINKKYGHFKDLECKRLTRTLLERDDAGVGRITLNDFYSLHLPGSPNVDYLRELGALDESAPGAVRVIVPNYVYSKANCVQGPSNFHSFCCLDECEQLFASLEAALRRPEASPAELATLVAALETSSVAAPRNLSGTQLRRLSEISFVHGGVVPIHGRLFAQWMHHEYPRECPFPHLAGTTHPRTPHEWMEATGKSFFVVGAGASLEVPSIADEDAYSSNATEKDALEWILEEEMLVETIRDPPAAARQAQSARIAPVLICAALLVSMAVSMRQTLQSGARALGGGGKRAGVDDKGTA